MAEKEKELTVEEKAALIGKDMGAIEINKGDDKEAVPDYEITEEDADDKPAKDAKKDDDAEDDEKEDKRLGKEREDKRDHKQLSNLEKRQLRKKRLAEKFDAKNSLIKQQAEQLNFLAARLNDVDSRFTQMDQAHLVQHYNNATAAFQQAEQEYKNAFKTGDSDVATDAMKRMYDARKAMDDLQAIDARNRSMQGRPAQPQAPDRVVVNRAQEWAKENPWFKSGSGDDDSAIADTIATKLVREGFDPKSDDYWDELDERLAKRGIGSDDDDDQQEQSQSQRERQDDRPRRRSPPVSGGGGRGDLGSGKVAITLPTAYINTLKENGMWDDVPKRNRLIAAYVKAQKERESEGRR